MLAKINAILIGSLLIGSTINIYFVPHHILDGGIIGLALIIHYLFGFPVGAVIILASVPIYVIAWFHYRPFFYNSIAGLIFSAVFIDLFSSINMNFFFAPPLPSAIIGGVILGVGVGIMFLYEISTGGLDLFAQMLADLAKANIGIMIFIVDLIVIASGVFVITFDELILSTIAVAATGVSTTLITLKPLNQTRFSDLKLH